MNTPNKLSILRILMVPLILLFMLPLNLFGFSPTGWNGFIQDWGMIIAAILFVIASLTDMVDGKIARKYNLITDLGKFLDSLADKMLVVSILIALVDTGRLSSVLVIIIVVREFMVSGIRMLASSHGVVMAAAMIGKIKTTIQMIAIAYIMFEPLWFKLLVKGFKIQDEASLLSNVQLVGNILFYAAVVMTIISGIDYLLKNKHYLKQS